MDLGVLPPPLASHFPRTPSFSRNPVSTMKEGEEDYLYVPHVAVESRALRVRQQIIHRRTLEGHLSILKAHIDAGRSVYCQFLALISHSMGYPTETTFPRTRTQNCATLRELEYQIDSLKYEGSSIQLLRRSPAITTSFFRSTAFRMNSSLKFSIFLPWSSS